MPILRDMTKDEAVRHYGTQRALGDALGVTQPTVACWVSIPHVHQMRLHLMTAGQLKADPEAWGPAQPPATALPA